MEESDTSSLPLNQVCTGNGEIFDCKATLGEIRLYIGFWVCVCVFVYLWRYVRNASPVPARPSLPVTAHHTHSLSPCPSLDDLHMNCSLRRGCSNSPLTDTYTNTPVSEFTDTHECRCWLLRRVFISRKPQSFARRQMGTYLTVTPKWENIPLLHHMMIFLQRYPVDWSSVHILH